MNCRFIIVDTGNKQKNYRVSKSFIEQKYGPIEGESYIFYTASSRGKVISMSSCSKFFHRKKKEVAVQGYHIKK